MKSEWVIESLPLAAKIAREFANIPGLPHSEIERRHKTLVRNPKDRFPDAGKLLAAL